MDLSNQFSHNIHIYRNSVSGEQEEAISNLADILNSIFSQCEFSSLLPLEKIFTQLNDELFLKLIAPRLEIDDLYNFLNLISKENVEKSLLLLILNFLRRSPLLVVLYGNADLNRWFELILNYIDLANMGIWALLDQRRREYSEKTLFQVLQGDSLSTISYDEAVTRIEMTASALLVSVDGKAPQRVGIFAYNSLEMAVLDLACLSLGLENAMIPANSASSQLQYMLEHSEVDILFVGSEKLYKPVQEVISACKNIKRVISLNDFKNSKVEAFSEFMEKEQDENFSMEDAVASVDIKKPVTVMYTSGTTGNPKGILFTQRHMVGKRFARALALPKIGQNDSFLCYLPLFHTFGRYFELQGAIFWGAKYSFVEKPAIEILLKNLSMVKPSVFISIPKKWKQIYETVGHQIDIETAPEPQIKKQLEKITGENLRWGLSAAGYLDPDVFRFYQRNGVSLLSGFGMTEGTGGMLMTPPGKYKDDSLGVPLPGIEVMLGDDGELLVKGSYVFDEYLRPEKGELPVDKKGWFHSGDIMEKDNDGYYTIIDRKKEIYKNVKGQTVSPQKIENLFREFLSVKHVFLAGDHREYNTVLIVPNPNYNEGYLKSLNSEELQNFFSSLIVSINRFLAPYERIVNFTILEKDFDEDKELTPKKTFRRKIIENNYSQIIESLYQNPWLSLRNGPLELRIPNWFLREKGMTANELSSNKGLLVHRNSEKSLSIEFDSENHEVEVGNYLYHLNGNVLDFDEMLADKSLWTGNLDFVNFFGSEIFHIDKAVIFSEKTIYLKGIVSPASPSAEIVALFSEDHTEMDSSLSNIHLALVMILSQQGELHRSVHTYLEDCLKENYGNNREYILKIFRFLPDFTHISISRFVYKSIVYYDSAESFLISASNIWVRRHGVWDRQTMIDLAEHGLGEDRIRQILYFTKTYFRKIIKTIRPDQIARLKLLLEFLTIYTDHHPTLFKISREIIVHYIVQEENSEISDFSLNYFYEMKQQLRQWIGPVQRLAVDPETGLEYRWEEVIVFDEEIESEMCMQLIRAIKDEAVIKESIFIYNRRTLVQLRDIPLGGIWITQLESTKSYTCFRASIQTRSGESFDLKINISQNGNKSDITKHHFWLIIAGETELKLRLVEEFCSYWEKYDLWTEEFISSEDVGHLISRQIKRNRTEDLERIKNHWPNYVWSSFVVGIDFWQRTQKNFLLADMSYRNFIVPQSDYQVGARMVKLEYKKSKYGEAELVENFWHYFVEKSMEESGEILGDIDPYIIPYAIVESCGFEDGHIFLKKAIDYWDQQKEKSIPDSIYNACEGLQNQDEFHPFYPQKLYFAIVRFRRWKSLSQNESPEANAAMLKELFETYHLDDVEKKLPDTRLRFYNDTVFFDSDAELKTEIQTILQKLNTGQVAKDAYISLVCGLRRGNNLSEWEEFFLTRLTHPYLSPEDSASFVELEEDGKWKTEIVVSCFDSEGEEYVIRGPVNPKEVGKLHNLFLRTNLPVHFRPEHRFLVALNTRGVVIGGLFYFFKNRQTVRMEKIVVKSSFRRKGVSGRMMQEFFSRLRNIGVKSVSTGFYRPEFFYKFNFKIENKYEGLVKDLTIKDVFEKSSVAD